ncbi:hypothetical protein Tco_0727594 [Tanacetum coccineum]|uniref:Reverse transcriptase Ty1/copia-type domain-containing protein n=1 Tax=Tanacetum coccineum TaxID=301880 RepID=A0ABQ4YIT7_9ASTR
MVPPNKLGHDINGKAVNETQYRGMIGSLMYLTASRPDIQFSTCLCARYQANPKESYLIAVKRIFRQEKHLRCLSVAKRQTGVLECGKAAICSYVPIFCDNTSAIAISNNQVLHSRTKHIDIKYHFIREYILKGDIELHLVPTQYQLVDIFTKPLDEPTFKRLTVELGITTFRNALRAHYLPHSSMYVPPPSIIVVRPWFATIGYIREIGEKGTLKKIFLPPRWRLLMDPDHSYLGENRIVVIMEYLVKISKKARILELKRRHLKIIVLTSYTPYPSRKIRRICSCTSQETTKIQRPIRQENSNEEVVETMAKTMEQYISKTLADYGSGISRPKVDDKDHFELKGQFLKELRDNTFSDSDHEDVNEHIEKVLEIVDLFHEVILFYNGLDVPTRQILDSKGDIPTKTRSMQKYPSKRCPQLNNLGREIKKVNEKVYAAQVGCEQCKGPHYTKYCPLKEEGKTLEEAYYTQFGAPFQQGGQYRAAALGFYQRNNANPSYQERRQSMEESLSKFMSESTKRHEENSNLIKEI